MFEVLDGKFGSVSAAEVFAYDPSWGTPSAADVAQIERLMSVPSARPDTGVAA